MLAMNEKRQIVPYVVALTYHGQFRGSLGSFDGIGSNSQSALITMGSCQPYIEVVQYQQACNCHPASQPPHQSSHHRVSSPLSQRPTSPDDVLTTAQKLMGREDERAKTCVTPGPPPGTQKHKRAISPAFSCIEQGLAKACKDRHPAAVPDWIAFHNLRQI